MTTEILEALTPLLLDLLALLLTFAIGWLGVQAHRYLGLQIEARHREALHSAIMTGVRRSLASEVPRDQIVREALRYARTSVPDAIGVLVKDDGILREIAEAKLREVLEAGLRRP